MCVHTMEDPWCVLQATIGLKLDGPTWKANTPDAFSYEASSTTLYRDQSALH